MRSPPAILASGDGGCGASAFATASRWRRPRSPTSRAWLGARELRSTEVRDRQGTVDGMAMWTDGLSGYQRENGRKGIRNLVAVLAAADNVNPLARQLARRNPGVVYLPAS